MGICKVRPFLGESENLCVMEFASAILFDTQSLLSYTRFRLKEGFFNRFFVTVHGVTDENRR